MRIRNCTVPRLRMQLIMIMIMYMTIFIKNGLRMHAPWPAVDPYRASALEISIAMPI